MKKQTHERKEGGTEIENYKIQGDTLRENEK